MRIWTHALCIVAGIASPVLLEDWLVKTFEVARSASPAPTQQAAMTPEELVLEFDKIAFTQRQPREAAARFLAPDIVEHGTQDALGGSPGVDNSFGANARSTILHVVSDGDIVMVHSKLEDAAPTGETFVDIYRVASGKIEEWWHIPQRPPQN